jgi:hypothetical protein
MPDKDGNLDALDYALIIAKKVDRITELEAALEKYGRHFDDCGCIPFETLDKRKGLIEIHNKNDCTCGFEQALKK